MIYVFLIGCLVVFCQLQSLHAAPGADDPQAPRATTVTVSKITREDDIKLSTTGRLSIVLSSPGVYIPGPGGPIVDPCGQTWESFWSQNYWYFQCWANRYCRPYRGCWCNNCICVMFIVNPQSPPCRPWSPWDYASSVKIDGYL